VQMKSRTAMNERLPTFLLALLALMGALASLIGLQTPRPAAGETAATPTVTATPHVATAAELEAARTQWEQSAHADTYDRGQGANTTCARCKSPLNWDPEAPAAEAAHDCASCKRIPGQPRPDLAEGIPVPEEEWKNISCEVCHEPVDDSYLTSIVFWNNELKRYEPVESPNQLCAHCHEGRHGFEVVEEQAASPVHTGWSCVHCHGPHGEPAACVDCHDVYAEESAATHREHSNVNCTACHDAGHLSVALETDPSSKFYETYVTRRFAHTITSWPSHNLQTETDCRRCHHRSDEFRSSVAPDIGCNADGCHKQGVVMNWCPIFARDADPEEVP